MGIRSRVGVPEGEAFGVSKGLTLWARYVCDTPVGFRIHISRASLSPISVRRHKYIRHMFGISSA